MNLSSKDYVLIQISGPDFEPHRFMEEFGEVVGGAFGVSKTIKDASVVTSVTKWNSNKICVPAGEFAEVVLLDLIRELSPTLRRFCDKPGVKIATVIVHQYEGDQPSKGLYISRELVKALDELGADLDFDVVQFIRPEDGDSE